MANNDIGYYTLPVIISMEGVQSQVEGKLSKAFGNVGKKAGAALAQGSEAEVKKAIEGYEKLRDRAEDALGKVRIAEERLNKARAAGKTDQIVAAEERLAKARRDSNRLNREAIAGYDKIDAAQKRLADSMTGPSGILGRLRGAASSTASAGGEAAQGFLDGFGGPIGKLGSASGPIGIALAGAAALGLAAGKVLADNIFAGMDQLQAQADIAAAIGINTEQMKPIAAAAGRAYAANFGESVEANMDAARAAIQGGLLTPDASGEEIEKIVAQLSTVAKVTGEDIPSAVRAAGQAIRTGMAKDATEAFDLIVRAQQAGLNVSGDLIDTINEYSTQFRKLGITGEEAMGLIAQAVKAGARDSDVAADALKEFSIRSIDGSKASGQAIQDLGLSWKAVHQGMAAGGETARTTFQQVVSAIQAVEDPAKRAQIQVALFGTQSEDLGDALNAMDLDTAAAAFDNVAGATARAAETAGGTSAAAWERAKRSIEVSVDGMQKSLAEVFGPALQKIADWVIENDDLIIDFFVVMGKAAVVAAEFIVRSFGDIASAIGQIIAPLGDVQGAMLKFQAWQAEIRGDKDIAAQLREEAEAAFGWGEGLTRAGEAMKDFSAANLTKALDDARNRAKDATTETKGLGAQVDDLDGKKIDIPVSVDTGPAVAELEKFRRDFYEAFKVPYPGNLPPITAPGAAGRGGTGPIVGTGVPYGLPAGTSTGGYGGPGQDKFPSWVRDLGAQFGVMPSTYSGHQEGSGLNRGIDWVAAHHPAGSREAADVENRFAKALAASLPNGLLQVIYQHPFTKEMTGVTPSGEVIKQGGGYYRDDWAGHQDHVHTAFSHSVRLGGGQDAPVPVTLESPSGVPVPMPTSAPTSPLTTPTAPSTSPIDTSRLYSDVPQPLVNAFGPGYKPGIGTPGYNEYGEPGYWRVDPDKVQDAIWSKEDREFSAQEAERRAQEARAAREALNDDPNADATAIAGADRDVVTAERAAAKARRDAAKAAEDLAKAEKGAFTKASKEAKQAEQQSGGGRGNSDLSPLGGIFGSFLKETTGIDISGLMPLQMLSTALNSAGQMSQALQEHYAQPNASADPFGIPEIGAPPMPVGGGHGFSGGLPGPGTIVNVDQSQNFQGANLGWDPVEVEKQRTNNINRAPRLPAGIG